MKIQITSLHENKSGTIINSQCYHSHFIDDDKTFLVIGPKATDDQLLRAGKRFGLDQELLFTFRESLNQ